MAKLDEKISATTQYVEKLQAYMPKLPDQGSGDVTSARGSEDASSATAGAYSSNEDHIVRVCRRVCLKIFEQTKSQITNEVNDAEARLQKDIDFVRNKLSELEEVKEKLYRCQVGVGLAAKEQDFQFFKETVRDEVCWMYHLNAVKEDVAQKAYQMDLNTCVEQVQ